MTDKELYQELMHRLNGPAHTFQLRFVEEFTKEHPTLQQALVRHLVCPALEVILSQRPDPRNQASYNFAAHALEADHYFPII
jgi:hypothetical protein